MGSAAVAVYLPLVLSFFTQKEFLGRRTTCHTQLFHRPDMDVSGTSASTAVFSCDEPTTAPLAGMAKAPKFSHSACAYVSFTYSLSSFFLSPCRSVPVLRGAADGQRQRSVQPQSEALFRHSICAQRMGTDVLSNQPNLTSTGNRRGS